MSHTMQAMTDGCVVVNRQMGTGVDSSANKSAIYRMAGNFGGKIFWRIAENMSFGGIYFGG